MPATDAELDRVLNLIDRYPLYDKLLVSEDRSIISILIKARAVKGVGEDELFEGFDQEAPKASDPSDNYLSNEESIEISAAINKIIKNYGSSEKFMGDFWFRKSAKCMI